VAFDIRRNKLFRFLINCFIDNFNVAFGLVVPLCKEELNFFLIFPQENQPFFLIFKDKLK
jgi:hypothetical protein